MKILARTLFISCLILVNAVSAKDNYPLLLASATGDLNGAIRLVEEFNYDINGQDGSLGMTALHYSLWNKKCDVAKYLINKGARIDIKVSFYNEDAAEIIAQGFCKGQL